MKARLVEDNQRFERTENTRASMGIGGIVYQDEFGDEFKDFVMKWQLRLKNDLEGRTITTICDKYDGGRNIRATGTWTFKVAEVLEPGINFDTTSKKSSGDLEISLWVLDEDGNRYNLGVLDKKIYIE